MLTDLLWFVSAKQQHDIQKSAGLAGICGVLLTLFIVWQWDNIFSPIIHFIGLEHLINQLGLVQDTPIHTIYNVLIMGVAALVIIAVLFTLPTMLVLALAAATENKWLSFLLSYIVFFFLSPIIFCCYLYIKLNERYRLDKGPETLKQHYLRDPQLRDDYKEVEQLPEQLKLHQLYTKAIGSDQTATTLSYTEAVTHLNRAVASIETDRQWLIGYQKDNDQFYVLFPNPLPVYASPCFKDKTENDDDYSTFGYKDLRFKYDLHLMSNNPKDTYYYLYSDTDKKAPSFYVPAYKISYHWDDTSIQIDFRKRSYIDSVNVEELTMILKYEEPYTHELFDRIAQQDTVFETIKEAHMRSFLIPIAFPEELEYYNDPERLSYIRELNKVPYIREYSSIYRADVEEAAIYYADHGSKWAIEYIQGLKNS
ncbi:hypothetical protein M3603_15690 [Rummeliibacillus stabekisii]|uniref:hypothetical protein n=1 Tax=Rummeliibacillus stabekisii TaxID=241244 RepID=UPI0020402759|nr:hypothetical protein [Rummeliibacillus stabekisii]MCM3318060.1 hypothetical protein [Rummeliibacillus stabekisii]